MAVSLTAALAACNAAPAPTQHQSAVDGPAAIVRISASALARAYDQDALAAGRQFEGHLIQIDGTVQIAKASGIVLATGDAPERVLLTFEGPNPERVAKVKTGAMLTARCRAIELKQMVTGQRCTIDQVASPL